MIQVFIAITLLLLCIGIIILWLIKRQEEQFGILTGHKIYSDTEKSPGVILYSKTINLAGKPDYIIKDKDSVIPVEVKTGKTPSEPYQNHVMQLMSYCLLVEEDYGKAPIGGYLKYPQKEFKLLYTEEAKEGVINLVKEITQLKVSGEELYCSHQEHNFS